MKSNEKKMILVLLIILFIVIGIRIFSGKKNSNNVNENNNNVQTSQKEEKYVEYLDDGTKVNTSKALSKERKLGDLKITNITLSNQNGQTVLLADVENTGKSNSEQKLVSVTILDKDGNQLITLKGLIIALKSGEKTQLNIGVTSDFSNAYDFKIEEINQ